MPMYSFVCKDCEKEYDALVPYDETGKYKKVVCEFCGSKKKEKLVTVCGYKFANPVGTDRWMSDDKGHDYRYKYNLPNVAAERARGAAGHMGPNPYGDESAIQQDLNDDSTWNLSKDE